MQLDCMRNSSPSSPFYFLHGVLLRITKVFPVTKPTVLVMSTNAVVDAGYNNLLDIVCMTGGFLCCHVKEMQVHLCACRFRNFVVFFYILKCIRSGSQRLEPCWHVDAAHHLRFDLWLIFWFEIFSIAMPFKTPGLKLITRATVTAFIISQTAEFKTISVNQYLLLKETILLYTVTSYIAI